MAKAKNKERLNYNAEVKALRARGPGGVYLLYGPEEYLRERYLDTLRALALDADDTMNHRKLSGQSLDLNDLGEAVSALPFFGSRVFVEVRDYDLNRCKDAELERLKGILQDLPDFCTLAFVQSPVLAPDGRLGAVKLLKKLGHALAFTEQEPAALSGWIAARFRALGKEIGRGEAEYLLFLSGSNMNALIPEIEKAAAYAPGPRISRADLDATVHRPPEADVFAMTDLLAARRYDEAAGLLGDLLSDKDNHPIFLLSLIGQQVRRLYTVRAALDARLGRDETMELLGTSYSFVYNKLREAAARCSLEELGRQVCLCAEYDWRMKSTGLDAGDLIRELFARLAAGV